MARLLPEVFPEVHVQLKLYDILVYEGELLLASTRRATTRYLQKVLKYCTCSVRVRVLHVLNSKKKSLGYCKLTYRLF